ncbi:efflux RND transporter periplasmic adaptor subunit [Cronobacter sakazakii]|uniref:efflux RND transporter periplasmic adaptor subunit n=1 Tax=Cronobacter sakazakii TaxID=28141 RepID=UPI0013763D6F|nr:efflux RND transporter periplasmic adaptor subunit [Cronobacter sakazakii]NCH41672.1 efflux RND transporter periplasmic adaptor subunit [Cronobacter sakazakii]
MINFPLASKYLTTARLKPFLLFFLVIAFITGLGLILLKEDEQKVQVVDKNWLQIRPERLEQNIGLVGRIEAVRQQTLSDPFEGVIKEIMVQEGQRVAANQILAHINPEQIQIQLRQAQGDLLKAQRELHQLKNWSNSPDVVRARRALKASQDELNVIELKGQGEEYELARLNLVNAQARFQMLLAQSQRQIITAPFAGVIVRQSPMENSKKIVIQPGMTVNQGTPLLTLVSLDHLQVVTKVEESDIHRIHEGMPVKITGDGFVGEELEGHVSAIAVQSDAADASGMSVYYDVIISVDTPSKGARIGMSAHLAIILYMNEKGIAVPPEALHQDINGVTWVNYRAAEEGPIKKIEVKTGKSVVQGIEVKGLEAGYIEVPLK